MSETSSRNTGARAPDPTYLPPGTRVGLYNIINKLGAGGMGTTYLVERDGHHYALKMMRKAADGSEPQDGQMRVRREVAALCGLAGHANIVNILGYDFWPTAADGLPYIVMEYVDGLPLLQWREQRRPSLRVLLDVLAHVANALAEAHRLQIPHRDVKSENVLVRAADDIPVIIDWGISRPASSATVTQVGSLVGTLSLLPPEYWTPRGAEGPAMANTATADIWCLGLLAYHALTGRSAFPAVGNDQQIEHIDNLRKLQPQRPSLVNPALPPSVDDVGLAMLEKQPANRIQTCSLVAEALWELVTRASGAEWEAPLEVPSRVERRTSSSGKTVAGKSSVQRSEEVTPGSIIPASVRLTPPPPPPPSVTLPAPSTTSLAVPSGPVISPAPRAAQAPVQASAPPATAFVPPTGVHTPAFVPPVVPAAAPAPQADEGPRLPTAVIEAQRLLKTSTGPHLTTRVPLVVMGGLVALALVFLAVATLSRPAATEKPRSLLEDAAPESHSESGAKASTAAVAQLNGPAAPSPDVQVPPAPSTSPVSRAGRVSLRGGSDAAAIDDIVRREYGRPTVGPNGELTGTTTSQGTQGHPTGPSAPSNGQVVPAAGQSQAAVAPAGPSWLRRARRTDEGAKPTANEAVLQPLGVKMGTGLPCRLLSLMDSRTCAAGPVQCVLPRAYIEGDAVLLPMKTMFYGTCGTTGANRFTIQFTSLKLPDGTVRAVDGLALDSSDRQPGLAASRVLSADTSGEGVGAAVAKGAANVGLGTVSGGVVQDMARQAGQTVVNQSAQAGRPQEALVLDPGADFTIFVRASF